MNKYTPIEKLDEEWAKQLDSAGYVSDQKDNDHHFQKAHDKVSEKCLPRGKAYKRILELSGF